MCTSGKTSSYLYVMMLLIVSSSLTPVLKTSNTSYVADNDLETCLNVVKTLVSRYIPSLKLNLSKYEVLNEQVYTQYTGFKTQVFKLNLSNAVKLEVTTSIINQACYAIKFEVTLDFRGLNATEQQTLPNIISDGIVEMFNDFKKSMSSYSNVSIVGGQLIINETPVYFFKKDVVSLTPATLTYRIYSAPPLSFYTVFNEYPLLEGLVKTSHIRFNLSEVEALDKLKKFNVSSYKKIFKAFLIYETQLRPAYIVVIDPSTTAVVMGDTGEAFHPLYSKSTIAAEERTNEYPSITYVIYLMLLVVVLALAFLIYFTRLRSRR